MCEGSDHPPELLVSQDIRSCIELPTQLRSAARTSSQRRRPGDRRNIRCCNPCIAQAKRTRPRSPESLGRLRLFNIKIALLIEGQSAWANRHSGHPVIAARSAGRRHGGVVAAGHDGGQTETDWSKASVTGSASASGNNPLQRPRG